MHPTVELCNSTFENPICRGQNRVSRGIFCAVEKLSATLPWVELSILVAKKSKRWYNLAMNDIKQTIADNLVGYRKKAGLTQQQLAEKLNYSDKAVSKWERAEAIPDVVVLKTIADIYGIKVDDFFSEQVAEKKVGDNKHFRAARHWLISLLSVGLVYLVATIVTVVWLLVDESVPVAKYAYLVAVPISLIVAVVFSCVWGRIWQTALTVSGLIWSLCVVLNTLIPLTNSWLFYLIGAALQVLVILWFVLLFLLKKGTKINDKTFVWQGKNKTEAVDR